MEEKIVEMFGQILNRLDHIENNVNDIKSDIRDLKSDVILLKQGQGKIENKLDNIEALNANRHIEINGKLDELTTGLTVVEAVTGKNMADIANIKLVK